jgi:hypothetical protein
LDLRSKTFAAEQLEQRRRKERSDQEQPFPSFKPFDPLEDGGERFLTPRQKWTRIKAFEAAYCWHVCGHNK